ncbi:phospholipase D-like domain-containing protein [Reinekea thalattae]|uniref:Phospholipase D-like domain-containing protein n=1 Tax=Reinekea thalattae TaxID=2593301 RepID=A0A5C8ZAW1_9GAMM|nr:phospholipase D-like domain-containing protein [Reinekea thalattae]TXR54328.1 hypothetical protein FME95_07270 [Reinekea thalattae]
MHFNFRSIALCISIALLLPSLSTAKLPDGVNIESESIFITDAQIDFLYDLTVNIEAPQTEEDEEPELKERLLHQEIFDNVYQVIDNAEQFLVLDMFLFMHDPKGNEELLPLAETLKNNLVAKRQAMPTLPIYFITDEFNTFYRSYNNPLLVELEQAGVEIIYTDMTETPYPNRTVSWVTNITVKPFGLPDYDGGWLPGPVSEEKVAMRSMIRLLDFKANHRKLIISEQEAMIMSANPHTASSLHSNVGIRVQSTELVQAMLQSEQAIAEFSDGQIPIEFTPTTSTGDIEIKYVTENQIEQSVLTTIEQAKKGDRIDIGMFYFSRRSIIKQLKKAAERGVIIELVLDANKDAFGREKSGIPNRQTAYELEKKGIAIHWYNTHGEQFHSKIFMYQSNHNSVVILGSGNYTKRNLGNYNLEANLYVDSPNTSQFTQEVAQYFNEIKLHSLPFEAYRSWSPIKRGIYRFQEWSGLSTF